VSGHWHPDEEAERIELLIARRIDGLVILSGKLKDAQILKLSQRVPIVAFGRALDVPVPTASAWTTTGAPARRSST
jgi:LacI family transcriptional regulator